MTSQTDMELIYATLRIFPRLPRPDSSKFIPELINTSFDVSEARRSSHVHLPYISHLIAFLNIYPKEVVFDFLIPLAIVFLSAYPFGIFKSHFLFHSISKYGILPYIILYKTGV